MALVLLARAVPLGELGRARSKKTPRGGGRVIERARKRGCGGGRSAVWMTIVRRPARAQF
jgi:hypothetical protein